MFQLKALKDGEEKIILTETSIKNISFFSERDVEDNRYTNILLNGFVLEGYMNGEDIINSLETETVKDDSSDDTEKATAEIDEVRKLVSWAVIPEYEDCYLDVVIVVEDITGKTSKTVNYKNVYVHFYEEKFGNDNESGTFTVRLREKKK